MKYSAKFNDKFSFFLKIYRTSIIDFCGEEVSVRGNHESLKAKAMFMLFENGEITRHVLWSRHPNILKAVLIAKKGWGLWVKEWSSGIADGLFSRQEILGEFETRGIEIPEAFLKEFDNAIRMRKYPKVKSPN